MKKLQARRLGVGVALLLLVAALCWWITREPPPQPASTELAESAPLPPETLPEPVADPAPENETDPPAHPLATELLAPGGSTERDLEILRRMIRDLFEADDSAATEALGINEDFTQWLTGDNRLQLPALAKQHPAVVDGQLVDRWGTPLFFHPIQAGRVEIRSAGPDRELFTSDDLWNSPIDGPTLGPGSR